MKFQFINAVIFGLTLILAFQACKETDDVPPVINLKGADSLDHILNVVYLDAGATAFDEVDGDISDNLYADNQVNDNLLGEYFVTYHVVDKSGNEATPKSRYVQVINAAWTHIDWYAAEENILFPEPATCFYNSYIWVDSTVNNRIVFYNFSCDSTLRAYADIKDTLLVMPFQIVLDSVRDFSLQGSGTINDTLIQLEYTKTSETETAFIKAIFNRL
ncbi:MAG: DUF5011 domain-containing protein [Bacteroidales bacterium]|nr:DUF5011 domain-containing protein [Bacteroidales bacterium]MCF8404333.1 DUF5011 domain-containing protein [Bacteroidales bacterium]